MLYYLKQAIIPVVYLFFMAITAFGILCIQGMDWLQYVLLTINLGFYLFIIGRVAMTEGEIAIKTRIANDLEREQIILTGEDRELNLTKEYKPYKGYLFGLSSCLPLLIMLLIHTIMTLIDPSAIGAGSLAAFIHMAFFGFLRVGVVNLDSETIMPLAPSFFYWMLLIIPIMMLTTGISYMLGARKIELQQEAIKERQKMIYGE